MRHKFRLFTTVLAVMLCMMAFSVTAFADGGDYYDSELPPETAETVETPEEPETPETPETTATPLTPEGNMTLVDDIDGDAAGDKQFIVVQSKGGNYFYIIIDKANEDNNTVHFLNQVDEADLLSLIDEEVKTPEVCNCADKCAAGEVNMNCPICKNNMSECVGKEKPVEPPAEPENPTDEPDSEKSGSNPALLVLLLAVLGGGGALYYFKFKKAKPDTKGPVDLDDYDYGDDDEDDFEAEEVPEDDTESEDGDV